MQSSYQILFQLARPTDSIQSTAFYAYSTFVFSLHYALMGQVISPKFTTTSKPCPTIGPLDARVQMEIASLTSNIAC
jgi:hypothetical protein